jgi:hypothetical protein
MELCFSPGIRCLMQTLLDQCQRGVLIPMRTFGTELEGVVQVVSQGYA